MLSKVFWEMNLLLLVFFNGKKKRLERHADAEKKEHGYREREQAVD